MNERTSLLSIDFALVTELMQEPHEYYFSRDYLRRQQNHMQKYQPGLKALISRQPISDPVRNRFFRAGALGAYDLVVTADSAHWTMHKLRPEVLTKTRDSFLRTILIDENDEVRVRDDRVVANMEEYYESLTNDSLTFSEWLQARVDGIPVKQAANDFIFGTLLTALPFYFTREEERQKRLLDF